DRTAEIDPTGDRAAILVAQGLDLDRLAAGDVVVVESARDCFRRRHRRTCVIEIIPLFAIVDSLAVVHQVTGARLRLGRMVLILEAIEAAPENFPSHKTAARL